jgi:CRISPR/Cas system type I-B associated protein Csh2 (Cas7 group RAMP superfamily)
MKKPRPRTSDPTKVTLKNFKRLETMQRLRKFQDQQRLVRQLRDAAWNADALEGYLSKQDAHTRSNMPDARQKLKDLVERTFVGRGVTGQNVVDAFPSQYQRLREVLK